MVICSIDGCETKAHRRGFCIAHYGRWLRLGDPLGSKKRASVPAIDRIMKRVTIDADGCWTCSLNPNSVGYPMAWTGETKHLAHRLSYEHHRGPIPAGMVIDHLCRNRRCVNPDHLEATSFRENVLRGVAPSAMTFKTNRCQRGHDMADAYVRPSGKRECSECARERDRKRAPRRHAQRA